MGLSSCLTGVVSAGPGGTFSFVTGSGGAEASEMLTCFTELSVRGPVMLASWMSTVFSTVSGLEPTPDPASEFGSTAPEDPLAVPTAVSVVLVVGSFFSTAFGTLRLSR